MTNINCSSNCIYQKEGKCSYTIINPSTFSSNNTDCIYFKESIHDPIDIKTKA